MDEQKVSTAEDIERSDPKDAEEQFQLAQRYFKGSGTKKDYEKAAEWYGKAALQGHAGAQFKMGQSYMKGLGVEEDHKKAAEWYEKAGENGHSLSAYTLGEMYFDGDGVEDDLYKAKEWLERSREHAKYTLIHDIDTLLNNDHMTTAAARKTEAQLRQEAEEGDTYSMYKLSNWFLDGKHVRPDPKEARYWAEKLVKVNGLNAYHQMGLVCEKEGDLKSAFNWFMKGAEGGEPSSAYKVGMYYFEGTYVKKDLEKAVQYLGLADDKKWTNKDRYQYEYENKFSAAQKELNKQKEKSAVEKKEPEEKKTGRVTRYREPIWIELGSIVAAVLVIYLSVLFVRAGIGSYSDGAVMEVRGFKKLLVELVCIGGIIGLSTVSLSAATLSLFDTFELGTILGPVLGIAAVIFLNATRATQKVIFIVAGAVIVIMLIKAIRNRIG